MAKKALTRPERRERDQQYADHVAQNGDACQLCGRPAKTRRLDWDHDHATGLFRGWLCHRCNRALPTWVTPGWLMVAAVYLGSGPYEAGLLRASILEARGDLAGGVL